MAALDYCLRLCDAEPTCRQLALAYDPERTEAYIHTCSDKDIIDGFIPGLIVYQRGDLLDTFEHPVPPGQTIMTLEPPAWQLVRLLCGTFLFCGILFVVNRWFRKFQMGAHGMQNGRVATSQNQARNRASETELSKLSENVFRYLKTVPYVHETKGGPLDADADANTTRDVSDNEICCSICLEPFTDTVTKTPCGHMFHRECIQQWLLNTKKECPNCRHKIYCSPPPEPPSDEEDLPPPASPDEDLPPPFPHEEPEEALEDPASPSLVILRPAGNAAETKTPERTIAGIV